MLGWPIMLPERMRARRASSSGEARGTTTVATQGPIVAGPNAGTRITTRHVNPTPSAAFALNSAKASTALLCCGGARVCKGYNREKADGQQITHRICPPLLTAPANGKAPSPCVDKPGAPSAIPSCARGDGPLTRSIAPELNFWPRGLVSQGKAPSSSACSLGLPGPATEESMIGLAAN